MNGGCGFMGKPHPSHLFETPHLAVYKTAQVVQKKLMMDEIQGMKNQCLQDEGVGCSSGCMRAFMWDFKGSCRVPKVPNEVPNEVHARSTSGWRWRFHPT
jgi:hypothetical protein